MNIVAVTQARIGSSRLPGKVLKEIEGKTLLQLHIERALQSKLKTKFVVATTTEPGSEKITAIAEQCGVEYYQGSVDDVLDRFYTAAKMACADYVVRITSDCPLIDGRLIDQVIRFALDTQADYASNGLRPTFPDGQDVEVFRFSALEKAWKEATKRSDREHVTPYIWRNSSWFGQALFSSDNFAHATDYNLVRLTVDEPRDFAVIERMVSALGTEAGWETYAQHYLQHREAMFNAEITRNEGYLKSLSGDQ